MSEMLEDKNYYEILELSTDASPEDVYNGYLRAKNAYSQDSLALYSIMSEDDCKKIQNLIEEAYSILSEPEKRRKYDEARGLNIGKHYNYQMNRDTLPSPKEVNSQNSGTSTGQNMTKIVAKKRFGLEYSINQEFEKEIEQRSDFTGEFLKKVREYKNVDIPRLSDMTKVSKTYLRHIEDEHIEGLPAEVYTRGFVYQYAKCLKLNPDLVASSYMRRFKQLKAEKNQN